ncbi:MAG: KAP family P-loop NTPase fold protein [Cetobacterium sp.]
MWKDSETKADYLEFNYLKMILKDIIENLELSPSSIGIYGDWGSGKSSLMGMLEDEFKSKDNIVCIKFNGWLFEGYEDAKTSFIGSVLDELSSRKGAIENAKELFLKLYKSIDLFKIASSSIKNGASYLIAGSVGGVPGLIANLAVDLKTKVTGATEKDIEEVLKKTFTSEELRKSIKDFRKEIKELLDILKIDKVIIFIDELDRCNSNTIIETLEAIRLFIFAEKANFIIGADERHVQNAVEQKFRKIEGSSINIGKEYLEKLIQYPVKIPPLNQDLMKKYIICLFLSKKLDESEFQEFIKVLNDNSKGINFNLSFDFIETYYPKIKDKVKEDIFLAERLSPILAKGLNGNPRHCKRFLNTLVMREKMASYKGISLKRAVLAKIMILEYFYDIHFLKLQKLLNLEGIIEGLIDFENGEEVESLKDFTSEEKIKKWLESEPSLKGEDLRPYLYFAKSSLFIENDIRYRLSPEAEEVYKNLLTESKIFIKKALSNCEHLNEVEANIIFKELKKKIYKNEAIDLEKLKLLFQFCMIRKELKNPLMEILKEIPGKSLNFGIFVVLEQLWIKFEKDSELIIIIKKWIQENSKLKKAYEDNFKEII